MDRLEQRKFELNIKGFISSIIGTDDVQVYYGTHYHMDGSDGFGYYSGSMVSELLVSIPSSVVPPLELINELSSAMTIRYDISESLGRCLISYELGNTTTFLEELEKLSKSFFDQKFIDDMEIELCSC